MEMKYISVKKAYELKDNEIQELIGKKIEHLELVEIDDNEKYIFLREATLARFENDKSEYVLLSSPKDLKVHFFNITKKI